MPELHRIDKRQKYCYSFNGHDYEVAGLDIMDAIESRLKDKPDPKENWWMIHVSEDKLKSMHISLSRAIESGDPLTIGLVLGQTVKELENIINS